MALIFVTRTPHDGLAIRLSPLSLLYHINPDFEAGNADVVGCGSTLGNLLRFAAGADRSFHFKVEYIGKTLFLVRQEQSPTELLQGVRGYGHTFPEAYTTWDFEMRGSASHQRLIQYSFGGLKLIVRSETDGYLKGRLNTETSGTF